MRLHLPLALALALLAATRLTPAQVCEPTTQLERQFRSAMKHRAPGPAGGRRVVVGELAAWPPPAGAANFQVRRRDAPIDPREQQAVVLEGDLWRVVVEDNDCDLHLEVSAPGGTVDAPRVIAEVPAGPGYEAAREAVLEAIHLRSARARDRVDLATPVRVRLTGYGFWDGAHWCRRDGVRGCGHGTPHVATLWELHPVWRVELVPAGAPARPDGLRGPRFPDAPPDGLRTPPYDLQSGSVGERLRCCDGTRSPTCTTARASYRGCCSHHGGVCEE